jgi:hypothetical protein
MSDLPPLRTNSIEFTPPPADGRDDKDHSGKDDPKNAILSAAIVCLEYAKQYLDKFTYWPDYILATHYHANILALTSSKDNLSDAEKYFKDVEFWLEPSRQKGPADQARRRIRFEAMYNRAVLTERKGQTEEARRQFLAVREALNSNKEDAPKGILFATEFALLMLTARELGFVRVMEKTSPGNLNPGAGRGPELRNDWKERSTPFLVNCNAEMERLRQGVTSAENELDRLLVSEQRQSSLDAGLKRKDQRGHSSANARQHSNIESKRDAARAKITKASKDLAILRMMVDKMDKLQKAFPSRGIAL